MTVRLSQEDYDWEQKERWKGKHPNIKLDFGNKNINKLIAQNRIFVATYNATAFLDAFAMNVPTVMFWNPNHWELRESVKPCFERLKDVGVFHETPESAAIHISEIWDNVDNWWTSDSVIKAVNSFCDNFNKINKNIVNTIHKELVDLMNDKVSINHIPIRSN